MEGLLKYYIIEESKLPSIFQKVIAVQQILKENPKSSILEVCKANGLSRSAYYKYRHAIQPFYDTNHGSTITFSLIIADNPGVLSEVLNLVAACKVNILTINQSIPLNNQASVTISVETTDAANDINLLFDTLMERKDVLSYQIIARE